MLFDIKPLSVNQAWKGKRFKTIDYKQYENDLTWLIMAAKIKPIKGPVKVKIIFHFKNNLSDIDNCLKPLFDVFVKNKIIEDDRFIYQLEVIKTLDKKDFFIIDIEKL